MGLPANDPSTWGITPRDPVERMTWITDRSMPLARALRNGDFDAITLDYFNRHQPDTKKVSMLIMGLVMEGVRDIYPSVSAYACIDEGCFTARGDHDGNPFSPWLDLVYTSKQLPRCSSGPTHFNLSYKYGDETAQWGRFFAATFSALRPCIGEPLDLAEPTHRSHCQRVTEMFKWRKLYTYWPWGYIDAKGEGTAPCTTPRRRRGLAASTPQQRSRGPQRAPLRGPVMTYDIKTLTRLQKLDADAPPGKEYIKLGRKSKHLVDSPSIVGQPLVVSFGMGTDSMAVLCLLHEWGIRPDLIQFADVGSELDPNEKPETYAFIEHAQEWFAKVGFPDLTLVRNADASKYDSLLDNCERMDMLPSLAYGGKSCSLKWKVAAMEKFVNSWEPAQLAWKRGVKVLRAIGYDASPADMRRAKIREDDKYAYVYPLRDNGITRPTCKEIIARHGLPQPGKSACFFCPASKRDEVIDIAQRLPRQTARALRLEARAENMRGFQSTKGLGRNWNWRDHLKNAPALLAWLDENWDTGFEHAMEARRKRGDTVAQLEITEEQEQSPDDEPNCWDTFIPPLDQLSTDDAIATFTKAIDEAELPEDFDRDDLKQQVIAIVGEHGPEVLNRGLTTRKEGERIVLSVAEPIVEKHPPALGKSALAITSLYATTAAEDMARRREREQAQQEARARQAERLRTREALHREVEADNYNTALQLLQDHGKRLRWTQLSTRLNPISLKGVKAALKAHPNVHFEKRGKRLFVEWKEAE